MKKGMLCRFLAIFSLMLFMATGQALAVVGPAVGFTVTGTPVNVTSGTPFNVTVTAVDAGNSTVTNYSGTVYLSSTTASSVLPPPYTFAPADNGVHVFSISLGTAGSQTVTATDSAEPGIIGRWKLDEGTGTTVADSTGNGNNGTLTGPVWSSAVPSAIQFTDPASLSFNGGSDVVDIPMTPALQLTTGTIAAWIKAGTDSSNFRVFLSDESDSESGLSFYLVQVSGELGFQSYSDTPAKLNISTTGFPLNDNTWHHVAAVFDNTAKNLTLYVDGIPRATKTFTGNVVPANSNLNIGQFQGYTGNYPFIGFMDDLRIYNQAMSATAIASLAGGRTGTGFNGTSAAITVNAGIPSAINVVAGTPQGAPGGAAFTVPFQVKVTDVFGNPKQGVEVAFAVIPQAGVGGTFTGPSPTVSVMTGVDGIATATTFTAGTSLGSYTVEATIAGLPAIPAAVFNLTNYSPPTFLAQPQPVTIVRGETPNVSATVLGTPPMSYQWYRGASGDTSSPVVGAVSSIFDQPLTITTSLWVQVTKYVTVINSDAALVTVSQPPAITVQPQHALVQTGQTKTLTVTATGDGTLAYQWYAGASSDTTHPIGGATASSYITPLFTEPAWYWVRITNEYGHADSAAARVTGTSFGPFNYITNFSSSSVSIIELASSLAVATIATPAAPWGVASSPDQSRIYISHNTNPGKVIVVNAADNTIVATIPLGVGDLPRGIGIAPDGSRLYVGNEGNNNVSVIDIATNTVIATIPVGSTPRGVAVHPDGGHVYVANSGATTVSVIDTATNTVSSTIIVGNSPRGLALHPDGSRLYVPNQNSNNVSVIDTATNTVIATVAAGSGSYAAALSPDGTRLYVTNYTGGSVTVINTADNSVVTTITGLALNPQGASLTPDGSRIYVTEPANQTVKIIDTVTNTIIAPSIAVGLDPISIGRSIPWDTLPDLIAIAPQYGIARGATITSEPVVVSGINVPVFIGVTGGEYAVNGGSFTTIPGLVRNGDAVAVRLVAPAGYNSSASAVLTVGGSKAGFVVSTTPEPGGVPAGALTIFPVGLVFADRFLATTSPVQTITVTNNSALSIVMGNITITGTNPSNFALAGNSCTSGLSLPVGGSCTIGTTFTPSAIGGRNAAVSIGSSAAGSPQLVTLFGGGTDPGTATYSNLASITIPNTASVATPYPSTITVAGFTGLLGKVRVTLTGVSHTWPGDFGVLLVGPLGQNLVLMNGAGYSTDIVNVNLTFDDEAASSLTTSPIVSGTYKPTDLDTGKTFNASAPLRPFGTTLAGFNGTDPNGEWKLYVQDFYSGDGGSISGWQLELFPPIIDVTPDPFAFAPKSTTSASTLVESDPAVITGLTVTGASIFTSAGAGEYSVSIDGGVNWGGWSDVPATVHQNDQVKFRVTSGASQGSVVTSTLSVGGFNASFSVTLTDTTIPVVDIFNLPTTSTSVTVPVPAFTAHDNVAVIGWMITDSATPPSAGSSDWRSFAPPTFTFSGDGLRRAYAWVKDGAGNVSAEHYAEVTITTLPVITLSALSTGTTTTNPVVNLAGTVTDPDGIATFTINGVSTTLSAGSFSAALKLPAGSTGITLIATDTLGHFTTISRTITYNPAAPELSVPYPADLSSFNLTTQPRVAVEGNFDPATAATIMVSVNGATPQEAMTSGNGFLHYVDLVSGINTIEITAVGSSQSSSVKRTIFAETDLLNLAVTTPVEDFFTPATSYLLSGTVTGNAGPVSLSINADNVITTPAVVDGAFEQLINLPTEKSYPITITATDGLGRSATLKRNIIRDRRDQTISFTLASPVTFGVSPITLSATSSCGLAVSFGSSKSTVAGVSGSTMTITGAGDAVITASQGGNAVCKPATNVTQALHVNKAHLTVTADNMTRALGAANPVFTARYSGFVGGQTQTVVTGAPAITTTATLSSPAGNYPISISQGTLSAANYDFTPFVNGVLTIDPHYGLDLVFSGTGHGGVVYLEKGIACNSNCTTLIYSGAHVTLIPYPEEYSLFGGWSGACTNATGNCNLTMTGSKTVTPTFTFNSPQSVQINLPAQGYYPSILGAYQAAASGATMKLWGVDYTESFIFNQNKVIRIEAGYNGPYTDNSGTTKLSAPMKIRSGKLGISKGVVKLK